MDKKKLAIIVALIALSATPAFADEGRGSPSRSGEFLFPRAAPHESMEDAQGDSAAMASTTRARLEALKDRIEERRDEFASSSAAIRANLDKRIKELVLARIRHAGDVLDAIMTRLANVADRIGARIDELKGDSIDASDAEARLAGAQNKLSAAEDAVSSLKDKVEDALASDAPRDALKGLAPDIEATKAAIRAAHDALMEAAQALPEKDSSH